MLQIQQYARQTCPSLVVLHLVRDINRKQVNEIITNSGNAMKGINWATRENNEEKATVSWSDRPF